ncbi:GntR family transcriptional regulator [Sphingobacterium corticis]|uniref:GntR family transcriptional regulator n=1 Tax=Sphingobacterium corticis TaxID=1812823 RepID=A0ABW5NMS4_9SPHI
MNTSKLIKSIQISDFSATPKYIQLADAVIDGVKNQVLKVGDILPSINELSIRLDISRDTVEKGYKLLKKQEIISSTPGKGYFIAKSEVQNKQKIAVFLNKLSAHKKIVYDAFAEEIGESSSIDLFVYNSDITHLRSLLLNLTKQYDHYVVFPHFKEGRDQAPDVLGLIPIEKLMLLGRFVEGMTGNFSAVFENYEKDIYDALEKALDTLSKYRTLKLIFPDHSDYPKVIIKGFYKFCQQYAFDHFLVEDLHEEPIVKGECFINIAEADLVTLLDRVISEGLTVGQDIGVVSYNETPLKKFILDGITTISTDFNLMGQYAAQIIKSGEKKHIEVPFYLKLRKSI